MDAVADGLAGELVGAAAQPAAAGAVAPARGADAGAVAAAPALGELDDIDAPAELEAALLRNASEPSLEPPGEFRGMAAELLDMLSTTRIAGYELAGPMTPEDLRIFQEGDVRSCVITVEAPPPTAAELRALRAHFLREADAHTLAALAKHADTPAMKNALFIICAIRRDPDRVHYSRVRLAQETLGLTDDENADAYARQNEALQAFCDEHYRGAVFGGARLLEDMERHLGSEALRPMPLAWMDRLTFCAICRVARDSGRTVAIRAAVRARDAEQLRGSRGGGSESEASFWPRAEGSLAYVHAEEEHVRAELVAIWWNCLLVLEQNEPGALERLFGETYEAAGPYAEQSDDEEEEEEAGADSGEAEEEEESSDEEDD